MSEEPPTPMFRKPKKKPQARQKLEDEAAAAAAGKSGGEASSDDESSNLRRVEDVRELQRTRERRHGLSAVECALGKARAAEIGAAGGANRGETGHDLQLSGRQRAELQAKGIEAGIREQFEKETLLRDEDEELRKFIEKGLKGSGSIDDPALRAAIAASSRRARQADDEILMRAAARIKGGPGKEERELLSNQMLAGIPEIDLGINARMANIVDTEKKKKIMLEKSMRKAMGLPEPEPEKDPAAERKRRRPNNVPAYR